MSCGDYLAGKPVSEGFATGPVFIYRPFVPALSECRLEPAETGAARERYAGLKREAEAELKEIHSLLAKDEPDKAKIFTAHKDILLDEALDEEILSAIDGGEPVDCAINAVYTTYMKILSKNKNPLIRERADDLRDVRNRLLRLFAGEPERNLSALTRPVIVAAHDLLPSDTATLDRKNVLAIITEVGGETSHSAIIAKSYEIPAILGIPGLLSAISDGELAAVDAVCGRLFVNPSTELVAEYEGKRARHQKAAGLLRLWRNKEPVTADGVRVDVLLNIGTASPAELEAAKYVDGVGLFRTEFLFMGCGALPTEDEQYEVYRRVLEEFGQKPVTLRTLDIGGDKQLGCLELPCETNPFLGNRALRLCLCRPDIFRTQLRAALRAGLHGNLRIMFPMVGSIEDIKAAKQAAGEAAQSLRDDGVPFDENVKLGIMIEIPAIALMAAEAAEAVDFASIGTNDLCQYLLAADRMNPAVANYYQSYHPAVFRLIGMTAEAFARAGKDLCVCGELGGDALAGPALVGLGLRSLSMGASCLGRCKKTLSALRLEQMESMAREVLKLPSAQDVEQYLAKSLEYIIREV